MKKPTTKKSKTISPKTLWIHSAWPADVQVAFVPNEQEWYSTLKKNYNITDEPYPQSDAQVTSFSKGKEVHCLVTITDQQPSLEQVVGLLSHEATHCYQKVRDWMKEKEPSIEFEAYTVGHITQSLLSLYIKARGVPKIA